MNTLFIIIVIALLAGAFYVVSVYNGLQALLTQIEAATQEIGNQLKRQANLIPNLEKSAKAILKQEKSIFEMLSEARKSVNQAVETGSASAIEQAEKQIQAVLPKLQVVMEDNPEMKSNETVQQFMAELRDTADKVTYARRAVIDLSQQYNQRLVVFPSNIIANMFGFKKQAGLQMPTDGDHLSVSDDETQSPEVSL
ncbi:LemA family protein [Candidatus Woesebacteria bacterium]|nr:LemA family protein [Candidatus Woesebacteria bacterium]MCD8507579.1 LemA family protein [Candidatus Woesebacteria bacterium]MCD8527420.1 LemA family protein [Candidatus Woesebacteria bacterium]MCD8546166.1 LemA family protein [Candidatus Woesebacteria bacterium]